MKNSSEKYKILCFLDFGKGRDLEILMPLVYYAEKYLHSQVEFAFLRDIHKIYLQKPDIVLLANAIGSKLHFLITKYAAQNNIPVFTLISEGNFRTDGTFDYWGYNTDKIIYQDYICQWSQRTKKYFDEVLPQYKQKNVVTGATGFDRYKIYDFISKEDYLKKLGYSRYKKVISYAGWAFGKIFNQTGLWEVKSSHKNNYEQVIAWMKEQMLLVEDILRKAVENNPDILFILKRHPNEIHPHLQQRDRNEMVNLKDYPNVLYTTTENIHDMISASDIFTGFETTAALETWLMKDTPTVLLNPDTDFNRDQLYKGSVIAHSYDEFQKYIDEFYSTGKISSFQSEEKKENRQKFIVETVGYSDGMNHIRAGYYLKKTLDKTKPNSNPKVKLNFSYLMWYYLVHIGKYFYKKEIFRRLPKFKKTIWIFDNLELKEIPQLKQKYFRYLDIFHEKNNIPERIKLDKFWQEILKY